MLLNKGADPNSSLRWHHDRNHKYYIDTTPLIEAIKISDLESIKILLDNGADINFCAERNLPDRAVYFNKARIRVKEPSDDLYIKPREKRTDDEKMYILKYETGELVNVSPIQIAYNYHHDSIVDYLLSRGATMKVNIRPTGIFPFPFTTLGEMLRRCKLYFIKQVGLCEEQYSALRTQVREFESTKELLRDWGTSNSAPYPRLFIPATQLLPDISHEFKSQYIALCSLFILEYWNATINSKTHIAAMADVDDIGCKICQIILWREIYPSHR